ncbi:MAG: HAMP domain-containing histidine kinase [Clostridia bacterium]|nr:HAMP domain-containing histidine kinase [Clostridia bacterium]MBQ3270943.1 HAMP domain-containing histidine kinase [Clostridia bacterium]
MELLPFIVIGTLLALVLVLLARIELMRRSVREIDEAFHDRLASDTNTLIDISSRDTRLLRLAADINDQLGLLRAQRQRFQQGDRELKEAITNLSHDLRTPLTAISGYLDLLDREEKSDAVRDYLARIRNRTDALKDLTEELFRYSMFTAEQALKREPVDLVRALEESLVSFYAAMRARGIEPRISLPETPVWRELDGAALGRVFANIIGNAVKYSDGDFSVSMGADGIILFENSANGLDGVSVGRLFDRFFTVQAGRASTGLGLSIAKSLTARMGGTVEAVYDGGRLRIKVTF